MLFTIFCISKLHELFPDFVIDDDERVDINISVPLSYLLITKLLTWRECVIEILDSNYFWFC